MNTLLSLIIIIIMNVVNSMNTVNDRSVAFMRVHTSVHGPKDRKPLVLSRLRRVFTAFMEFSHPPRQSQAGKAGLRMPQCGARTRAAASGRSGSVSAADERLSRECGSRSTSKNWPANSGPDCARKSSRLVEIEGKK